MLLLCLRMVLLYGQNYPVQVSLQLAPPYTPQLSALYTDPGRMGITLLNKDLATPMLSVYLQLKLEGPGITLQTRAGYRSPAPVLLTAGIPQMLGGAEIADLLQAANLDFQGLDRNRFLQAGQLLPEGLWRFSVTAFSTDRALQVSNTGSISMGLFKHKPPILNFPVDGARSGSQLPQYVLFQWTPRHYASPFAAGSIRYRLRLVELVPNNRNPNEAMQSSLMPLFETITEQTSYAYGPADPPLFPGRGYAWQVQALDVDGSDLFEQDGYSQVSSFVFGDACGTPQAFSLQADAGRSFTARWRGSTAELSNAAYLLWYRQVGMPVWQTVMVADTLASVGGLLPNTTYEARVTRLCLGGESAPTGTLTITTTQEQGAWDAKSKSCGKPAPQFDLSNRTPLAVLNAGESFTAADFTIKVLSAQGQNGEFSGSGLVLLPFTGKVPIPCTWEAVSINADRRLISGNIRILQQPLVLSNLSIEKLSDRLRDLFGSNWNRTAYKRMDAAVLGVENIGDGRIRIRTATGEETLFGGKNTVITDPAGKRWYVSAGGKITGPEGPAEKPIVADDARGEGMPGSVLPDGSMVVFGPSQKNALAWDEYAIRNQTGGSTYDRMDGPPGGYMAGWKLLKTGGSEIIIATLRKGKVNLHPDSTRFLRSDGVRIKSERIDDSTWKLLLPGRLHLWSDAAWAVGSIAPTDSVRGGARRILGKLNLIAADERKVFVKLIPVGNSGGNIGKGQMEAALNAITAKYGVKTGVEVMPSMAISGYNPQVDKISVNRMVLKTSYGSDLQRFIKGFEGKYRSPGNDTAVMFLLGPAADQTEGYMALNNRYGFIFCGNSPPEAHTIAHELGHGLLVLEHPFEESAEQVGKTLNLMDYRKPHALTHFQQWKRIHDKEEVGDFLRGVRQKEEEGRYVAARYTLNDAKIFTDYKNLDNAFIDPAGRVVERIDYKADNAFVARVLDNNYPYVVTALKVYRINGENYELINEYKSEFNTDGIFQGYTNFPGVLKYATGNISVPVFIIKSTCYYLKQKINYQNNGKIKKYEDLKIEIAPLINYKGWHPELFLMADAKCYSKFRDELNSLSDCVDEVYVKKQRQDFVNIVDSFHVKDLRDILYPTQRACQSLINTINTACPASIRAYPWDRVRSALLYLIRSQERQTHELAFLTLLGGINNNYEISVDSLFRINGFVYTKRIFDEFDRINIFNNEDGIKDFLSMAPAKLIKDFVNSNPDFVMDYYDGLGENEKQEFIVALATAMEPVWDRDAEIKQVHIYDKNNNDLPSGIEKHTAGCVKYTDGKFKIGKSSACFSVTDNGFLACDKAYNYKYSELKFIHDFTANCENINEFYPSDPTLISTGDGYMVLPAVISGKMIMDKVYDSYWQVFKANIFYAMPAILKTSGVVAESTLSKVNTGGKGISLSLLRGLSNVGKFTLSFRPTWKNNRVIQTITGKTTTLIGSYSSDIKHVIRELNYPKSTNFGPKLGEFNILNVPDNLYMPASFWDDYNKPWIQAATNRGDDIIIMSNKFDNSLLIKDGSKTGFGKEIDFMEELVSRGRYRFDDALGKYVAN